MFIGEIGDRDPAEETQYKRLKSFDDVRKIGVCIGCDVLNVMSMIRLMVEVIEETIGLDKMRENYYSLSMLIDLMFDSGHLLITGEPLLITFM